MTKVISFSLWGDNPTYNTGAIKNAELALQFFPDFECWFYIHKDTVPQETIDSLNSFTNTKIIFKSGDLNKIKPMMWRFEAIDDENVEIMMSRDTDTRILLREKLAVDEWLSSNKTFHIMRDHPHHGFPILGGMWGYKSNIKYPIKNLLDSFSKNNRYGTDYEFFANSLYPLIQDDKIVHDPFFDKIPFPTERLNKEFVGDVFDENDNRHPEYYKYLS